MLRQNQGILEQAMTQGYLICKSDQHPLISAYFNHCNGQECAVILATYAQVESNHAKISFEFPMDEEDVPWIRTKAWGEKVKSIIEQATGKLYRQSTMPGKYNWVKKVPRENVQTMAEACLLLAREDWQSQTYPTFVPQSEEDDLIRFHEAQRTGVAPSKRIRDMAAWRFKCWQESLKEEQ